MWSQAARPPLEPGLPRGGAKGVTVRGPGDTRGPGFRIVRVRMQNSLAQTTACERDVIFDFGPKFKHLRKL